MRGLKRTLLISLVVVLLLATGLFVALRALPQSDFIRESVRNSLEDITKQDVALGMVNVSISFPNLIHLTLDNIAVSSKQGEKLVSADRVTLTPSLVSLLKHEAAIESVTLEGLRLWVRRRPGGTIQTGFLPLDMPQQSSDPMTMKETENAGQSKTQEAPHSADIISHEHPQRAPLRWSVRSVRIVNSRIDWIDSVALQDREIMISLNELKGSAEQHKQGASFAFKLSGKLVPEKGESSSLTVEGFASHSSDMARLDKIQVKFHAESIKLMSFQPYLPGNGLVAKDFKIDSVDSEMTWEKDKPARISLITSIKSDSPENAQINFRGQILVPNNFEGIEECLGTAETDGLPLRFFKTLLPTQFLLDPEKGSIKAEVTGTWSSDQNWKLQGALDLQQAEPAGKFRRLARQVRVWTQIKLDPQNFLLDNFEISESTKLASLRGAISGPFSASPQLDLEGEAVLRSHWIKEFGTQLPEALNVTGSVPVKGTVKGCIEDPAIDVVCDLKQIGISWAPYLEKRPDTDGSVSLKGKLLLKTNLKKTGAVPEMLMHAGLSGINLRMSPRGQWLQGCSLQLDSRVLPDLRGLSLRDLVLTLRRGEHSGEILSAGGNILELGSDTARLDLNAAISFENGLPAHTGFEVPPDVSIGGKTVFHTKFSGTPTVLEWSVQIPLTNLDITAGKMLKKAGGVAGDLSAVGKWSEGELILTKGNLNLPGLVMTGQGKVLDRQGNFTGLTLDVKRAELGEISKLVPAASDKGLSGPVEGRFRLARSEKGIAQTGTIRLLEVDIHPQNAGWALTKIKGPLELDGSSLQIPEITGRIKGVVEAPLKVKGKLGQIGTPDTLNGKLLVEVGQGTIRAEAFRSIMRQTLNVVQNLIKPGFQLSGDILDIESISASCQFESGTVRTEDLRLRAPAGNFGAIGSLNLTSQTLDALACFQTAISSQTVAAAGRVLGKIPAVQKLVKQNEELLKITGLDKELKRLGIESTDSGSEKAAQPESPKENVTVIVRLRGPVSDCKVMPVFESALDKSTVSRLKALIN